MAVKDVTKLTGSSDGSVDFRVWKTPEEWEKKTGKPWPADWAVYYRFESEIKRGYPSWSCGSYHTVRYMVNQFSRIGLRQIVVATEAGRPPIDWKPDLDTGGNVVSSGEKLRR
jgi:hypothetical protein